MRFNQLIGSRALAQKSVLHLKDLAIIKDECLNLVIWKRPIDPDVDLYISYLITEGFKPINESVTCADTEKIVTDHLDAFGFPATGKIKLINDIIEITHQIFEITSASKLRLILKIVTDDACRKFHTDAYDLRLLCTYKGKATEWVEESSAKRSLLKTVKMNQSLKT